MTTRTGSEAPPSKAGGKGQEAKEKAAEVGQEATQAGKQVAQQAAEQGKQVAAETRRQGRDLVGEASAQMWQRAGAQQKRAAGGLRALGTQLQSMASNCEQDGAANDLVRRTSNAAQQAAGWLERREPGELVDEVRNYARQHPGSFLAGAAVAGLLVGRLTRGLAAADERQRAGQQPAPSTAPPGTTSGPFAETGERPQAR